MIQSYDEKKKKSDFRLFVDDFYPFFSSEDQVALYWNYLIHRSTSNNFKGNFYFYVSNSFNITQLCLHCRKKGKSHRQIGENPKNVARFVRLHVRIVIFVYSTFNEALLGGVANKYVSLRRRVSK